MNEHDLIEVLMDLNRVQTPYRFFYADENSSLYVEPYEWSSKFAKPTDLKRAFLVATNEEIAKNPRDALGAALAFLEVHGVDLSDYEDG